jgi:hypothetical protein
MNKKILLRKELYIYAGIIIIIPIIINLIMKINIGLAVQQNDWIGFFGGYVGGIFTLIGVLLTIDYYRKQEKEDKRISIMPYIKAKQRSLVAVDEAIDENVINLAYYSEHKNANESSNEAGGILFDLENIGLGTAVDIKFSNTLLLGSTADMPFLSMKVNDKEHIYIKIYIGSSYLGNFRSIPVYYYDLFGNKYRQFMNLTISRLQERNYFKIDGTSSPDFIANSSQRE